MSHYTGLNFLLTAFPKGLNIIGYPSNQFAGQEPADNDEILNCLQFVRPGGGFKPAFPLTQKISVNGIGTDGTWTWLKSQCPAAVSVLSDGLPSWVPIMVNDVAWNFETILFDKNGMIYRRYATAVDPRAIAGDVAFLLSK